MRTHTYGMLGTMIIMTFGIGCHHSGTVQVRDPSAEELADKRTNATSAVTSYAGALYQSAKATVCGAGEKP